VRKNKKNKRKTRTCIAFWTVKNCEHCVGSLSGNESGVDVHRSGLVLLSEVSLAEPLGRRIGTKQQTMGSRIEPAFFSATLRLRESLGCNGFCS
jgi:hypothetical protein